MREHQHDILEFILVLSTRSLKVIIYTQKLSIAINSYIYYILMPLLLKFHRFFIIDTKVQPVAYHFPSIGKDSPCKYKIMTSGRLVECCDCHDWTDAGVTVFNRRTPALSKPKRC
jgi:hypothetical protein